MRFRWRNLLRKGLAAAVLASLLLSSTPTHAANQIPKLLNYQARITNASGVPVADGNLNIWISVYNASSGGTCLYAMRGSCGTPSFKTVTVVDGVFSTLIGDTASGDVEIPESLFDNNSLFLGVTVASDTEMVPRKRISAAPYALNADKLDDLDLASSGSTTPYVVGTTVNGNLVITGDPQGGTVTSGSLTINPAGASASETLFGIADNGTNRWMLDKEGDLTHVGSLLATAASSTAQFIFRGAASHTQNIFEVQDSFTNRMFSVSATATTIGSTSSTDAAVFNSRVGSNLTPTTDNTFSLGDYNRRWKDLWLSGGSANIAYDQSGTSVMKIGIETATGYRGVIATPDNMPLQLRTTRGSSDTNGVYIATNGNVGVGTVIPNTKLNVVGGTDASYSSGSGYLVLGAFSGPNVVFDDNEILARNNGSESPFFLQAEGGDFTVHALAAGTEFTVLDSGNVGIGDASPVSLLTVGSGELFQVDSSGNVSTVGNLTVGNASGTDIASFAGSRIGSNLTPTTDATFDLGDYDRRWRDLWLSGGSANIGYDTSGTSVMKIGFETAQGYRGRIATPSGTPLQLRSGLGATNDGLYISTSNTLGIGTASPITQLHVPGRLPTAVGSVATGTGPEGLFVQGRYAYVAGYSDDTFRIYDVSNPTAPVQVSSTATDDEVNYVSVHGRYAYVTSYGGNTLRIWDVSNPAAPVSVGSVAVGFKSYFHYIQGRYAYVSNAEGATMRIFDVSNPTAPVFVGATTSLGGTVVGVFVQGQFAYAAIYGSNFLKIINIANPAFPVEVGSVATGSNPGTVWVQGRYAYVTNFGGDTLQVFDVKNPASPVLVSTVATGDGPSGIFIQGRYAYLGNYFAATLQVFDISNPAAPVSVGTATTGTTPRNTIVQGRYAYLVNETSNTLQIFDIGGSYIQQFEAGGVETGTLSVRNNLSAVDGTFSGGLIASGGLKVSNSAGIDFRQLYSTAVTSPTISQSAFSVDRQLTTNTSFASTLTVSGALATIADYATQTTGTITSTADVLRLSQNYASNSGAALNVTTAGTGLALRINDDGTFTDSTPFVIDASGNVGIGDTTPAALLTVGSGDPFQVDSSGNVTTVGTLTVTGVVTSQTVATISGTNDEFKLQVTAFNDAARDCIVWSQTSGSLNMGRNCLEWNNGASQANFVWRDVYNGGAGSTELMRLTGGGNVGIGNAAPANRLTVGNATSTFEVNAGGNIVRINAVQYSWPTSQGGASTVLTNNGSGSLTWTAGSGLTNLNQAYLNSTSTTEIYLTGSQGALTIADTFSGTGNIFEIQNRTNSAGDYSARYLTVSGTSTLINPAGSSSYFVGIGNSTPNFLLSVGTTAGFTPNGDIIGSFTRNGSSQNSMLLVETDDTANDSGIILATPTVGKDAAIFLDETDSWKLKFATGDTMGTDAGRTGSTQMTIDQSGRVGIGTTSPVGALNVLSSGTSTVPLMSLSSTTGATPTTYQWSPLANERAAIITGASGSNGYGDLVLGTNQAEAVNNVLGYLTWGQPQFKTNPDGYSGLKASIGAMTTGSGGTSYGFGGSIVFSTRGDNTTMPERMRIDHNGRVGIGNSAPANQLTVGSSTSTFEVNSAGNLVKVNNVPYSWPSSQGGASTVLQNNGSGTLSWVTSPGGSTLQTAYDSSTGSTEIFLSSARGALTLADSFSSFGGNLFEIQDRTNGAGDYSRRYLTVSSTATSVSGNLLVTAGATGTFPTIAGAGVRLMFIPTKSGAFRAGDAGGTQWDNSNIGTSSAAFGSGNRASGYVSAAFGELTVAGGDHSFTMGSETQANNDWAFAGGLESIASGQYSMAFGWNNLTTGPGAVVFGLDSDANADSSFISGRNNTITSSGAYGVAMGRDNTVNGTIGFALGELVTAGANGFAIGISTSATSTYGFAMGSGSRAGNTSFAGGVNSTANGFMSFAFGDTVRTENTSAIAIGSNLFAGPSKSMVLGSGVSSSSLLQNNIANSLMVGFNSTIPTLFVGPGSGAGTLGTVGIGTTSPGERLEVVGNIISKGTAWTSRTSAADNNWFSVTYGNGLFVAVATSGTGNRVMTSPDGINWTVRTSAADNDWYSVTYGNGLFVAVATSGTGNRVMTSPDGINWTVRTSAADNLWYSVTYGNGLFVAVSNTGTGNRVMTSPDGITWTSRTSASDNDWVSVTYGNGLFVATANTGSGNRVMTSPDGITWTSRTSAADNGWFSVTYGNGLFVAVSDSGTGNRVMTSPDGITWTSRTSAADNGWFSVTYGNGLFVAVAYNGTGNRVMTSPDGINWTTRTSAVDNNWYEITYGNGQFVAVATSGSGNRVMTSGKTELNELSANNIFQGGMSIFGNVGLGNSAPANRLTVGNATSTFEVDAGGNIVRINAVSYSWPSTQGGASTVLTNNGSGVLTWATAAGGSTMLETYNSATTTTSSVTELFLNSTKGALTIADQVTGGNGMNNGIGNLLEVQDRVNTAGDYSNRFLTVSSTNTHINYANLAATFIGQPCALGCNVFKVTMPTNGLPVAGEGMAELTYGGDFSSNNNSAMFMVKGNSLTTGWAQTIQANALTTGIGLRIASTSTGLTSGSLISLSSGTTGAVSTGIASFLATANYTSTSNAGLLNVAANSTTAGTVFSLSGTSLTNGYLMSATASSMVSGSLFRIYAGTNMKTANVIDVATSTFNLDSGQQGNILNMSLTNASITAQNGFDSIATFINMTSDFNFFNTGLSNDARIYGVLMNAPTYTQCRRADSFGCEWHGIFQSVSSITNNNAGRFIYVGEEIGSTSAAWVQNNATAGSALRFTGLSVLMPAITQTAGEVTSKGIEIRSGTYTSGTHYALVTDAASGNVGIGTLTPGALLDVAGVAAIGSASVPGSLTVISGSAATASFNRETDDGTVVNIMQGGNIEGVISVSGTTVTYGTFTGAHNGWTDVPIARGKVVSMDGIKLKRHGIDHGEPIYQVVESAVENDPAVLGSFLGLTEPSVPADPASNTYMIMAVGNGDAWIVENGAGDVAQGDDIVTSGTPGYGMKDPGTYAVSHVFARAAEAVDWGTVTDVDPVSGKKRKHVSVLYDATEKPNPGRISTDGTYTLIDNDVKMLAPAYATSLQTAIASRELSFIGSAWDAASSTSVTRSITTGLTVTDVSDYQLAFKNDGGQVLATLNQMGDLALAGSLTVNGGFDYAETFPATPDLEAGDIVMVDPSNANGYGVKKTSSAYESSAIGVISTKPGFLTGKKEEGTEPVALAGRVPVKVNMESGSINPGDPITSSSTPGVGMKAVEPGRVIGIALQGATQDGTILIFVNPSWWNGPQPVGDANAGSGLSVTADSLLDFKNSVLSNVAAIISTNGTWSITSDGILAAKKVEAEEVSSSVFTAVQTDQAASVSEGVIRAGYDAVVVNNPAMKPNSKVFVSFLGNPGSADWVAEKGEGNFTVHLAQPAASDLPFEYWIFAVDDRRSPPTESEPIPETEAEPTVADSGTSTTEISPEQTADTTNTPIPSENP